MAVLGKHFFNLMILYSYVYKLTVSRLNKMKIPMPFNKKGELDLEYIEKIVKNSYGFEELKQCL